MSRKKKFRLMMAQAQIVNQMDPQLGVLPPKMYVFAYDICMKAVG